MRDFHNLSAVELVTLYQSKSLSPVDVVSDVLSRIDMWEPHLHATYALDGDAARDEAKASETRWLKGTPRGPLDGVPTMIKENIATKGVPRPFGTAASELIVAEYDAPPVIRLREAGAIIVGKTTMPDYGMLISGLSSFHGLTRNPWDLSNNPGGSSAGAAAGAAAGYGPLHLGTDTGGSVRLPASWCGVFALKPSFGRIPIDLPSFGRVAGPITRTVLDAALMMTVISLPDSSDVSSLPYQSIPWQSLEREIKGLKIGLLMDAGWGLPLDAEVKVSVESAAKSFEAAGAVVHPIKSFMSRAMADGIDDIWRMRLWMEISRLSAERRAKILPFVVEWARRGADLSGARVFDGYRQRDVIRSAAVSACQPFDIVLSPTTPISGFGADLPCPTEDPERPFDHVAFTLPYNMSGQPAASINCGYTMTGLPIGLQIIGHRHDDLGVMQVARAWELMRPTQRRWPESPVI